MFARQKQPVTWWFTHSKHKAWYGAEFEDKGENVAWYLNLLSQL